MNIFRFLYRFILGLLKARSVSGKTSAGTATSKPKPVSRPSPKPAPPKAAEKPAAPQAEEPEEAEAPKPTAEAPLQPLPLKVIEAKRNGKEVLEVSNGKISVHFRPFRKGLWTVGDQEAIDFIKDNREKLDKLNLSESIIKVMRPVSKNEGNLDAINTWDNSFLTFGMFQWTIGAQENAGELPALLKKIQTHHPDKFQKYFGIYGLDIDESTNSTYGFLTLDGTAVKASSLKDQFRNPEWAFRFWEAGQDPDVMAIEIEHAASRLRNFYWKDKFSIEGHPIAEVITSEYGVALILDNHVNRPGYVDNCLRLAFKKVNAGDPADWSTDDEMKVIDAYLEIRKDYGKSPMTHAEKRADVTRSFLEKGLVSAERGSFVVDPSMRSRGGGPEELIGVPPHDYHASDYDDIAFDEENYDRSIVPPEEM